MKKIISLATLLAVSSFAVAETSTANTQQSADQVFGAKQFDGKREGKHDGDRKDGKGFFFDESKAVRSIQEAQNAQDDTFVILEGKIVKQLDDDEFLFRDAAGQEIQIDVSKRAWKDVQVTPNDTIEIRGKVDKEWNTTELDIKQITKK